MAYTHKPLWMRAVRNPAPCIVTTFAPEVTVAVVCPTKDAATGRWLRPRARPAHVIERAVDLPGLVLNIITRK